MDGFVDEFKKRLSYRLKGYSLELLDCGLMKDGDALVLAGWINRPISQEVKEFSIRFGMDIKEDSSDAIDELCTAVCTAVISK